MCDNAVCVVCGFRGYLFLLRNEFLAWEVFLRYFLKIGGVSKILHIEEVLDI